MITTDTVALNRKSSGCSDSSSRQTLGVSITGYQERVGPFRDKTGV